MFKRPSAKDLLENPLIAVAGKIQKNFHLFLLYLINKTNISDSYFYIQSISFLLLLNDILIEQFSFLIFSLLSIITSFVYFSCWFRNCVIYGCAYQFNMTWMSLESYLILKRITICSSMSTIRSTVCQWGSVDMDVRYLHLLRIQ